MIATTVKSLSGVMRKERTMIRTICYGEEKDFRDFADAFHFYLEAWAGSEGSEQERYSNILSNLQMGKTYCTDDAEGED